MTNPADRRRSPRVDLVGRVQGQAVAVDVPIRVREISLGGMSIETTTPFTEGTKHLFVLTLGDGAGVEVLGHVVYCRDVAPAQGLPLFISGLQFVDSDISEPDPGVSNLINKVS